MRKLQPTSPSALFYGVAANLLKEHWRKTAAEQGTQSGEGVFS
jgi:hypothetical protein